MLRDTARFGSYVIQDLALRRMSSSQQHLTQAQSASQVVFVAANLFKTIAGPCREMGLRQLEKS